MPVRILDMFSIGVGPSSSHTVGPMRAARRFATELRADPAAEYVRRIVIELFGSLALTGQGHGTHRAVVAGIEGADPESVEPARLTSRFEELQKGARLCPAGGKPINFSPTHDIVFKQKEVLPRHSNGMRFGAYSSGGEVLFERVYYSIGGGFVVREDGAALEQITSPAALPHPFTTSIELLAHCVETKCTMAEIAFANECAWCDAAHVHARLDAVWQVMRGCIERGLITEGVLPGMAVKRRAARLYRTLSADKGGRGAEGTEWLHGKTLDLTSIDLLSTYAIAVGEENAAGNRVVTAPTNGAAGIIPAVLNYYMTGDPQAGSAKVQEFLLTAGAIGVLFKEGASISGAEVGCQGEVGSASSMAAAGFAAVCGGSVRQVENAAEIAMEHHLGLTCDPVGGFVQIPCIERNALGAVKAVTAARLALLSDGDHVVSLDRVINTMKRTGADMSAKYKETSQGGLALAVTVPEC